MKLKDFIESLTALAKDHPESLDFKVIYCVDDEGNAFFPVNYSPSIGVYRDGQFWCDYELGEIGLETSAVNSVCIN